MTELKIQVSLSETDVSALLVAARFAVDALYSRAAHRKLIGIGVKDVNLYLIDLESILKSMCLAMEEAKRAQAEAN